MRNKLIVAALVVVGLSSVAYAAYAQLLTINGTSTAAGTWDGAITGIAQTSATGATDNVAPSFNATTATFDVDLAYPGATATYDITVENNGTIPAKITTIDGVTQANAAAPTYIDYTLSGVAVNTTISPNGGSNTATVTVEWDPASSPVTTGTSKTATITLDYSQDT